MFIGRDNELKSLNKIKGRGKAALVVMRGRRRIGKSRLISEFAKGFPTYFEFQGLGSRAGMNNQIQLDHFARQLSQRLNIPPLKLSDWREAFSFLARETQTGPVLIMLDEIAWMGKHDPDYVGKLKIAWDTLFKKNDSLILVLCGSVSSWIEQNILHDTNFVGRISADIRLNELPLWACDTFWSSQSSHTSGYGKLKFLSVTGGVPRYLEELNPKLSAEHNIHDL